MGNKHSKKSNTERQKIYAAQDAFVRDLVEKETDDVLTTADDDTHSIGPEVTTDAVLGIKTSEETERPKLSHSRLNIRSYNELDEKAMRADIIMYQFPFENLVFEGGGNKGLAYCGAVQVLEELGIFQNIKRFAGTSAGAMTASLLAVGYNSKEIREFLSQDLSKIFLDHACGILSLLPNLLSGYGWNPGNKIFDWFGQALLKKTGNADITFSDIYDKYNKELCIVVTNLNMMNADYFHPKTTPDVPVRTAVRMSMAIPGLFQASRLVQHGQENTYVDGGVLCNYPIHCYDGWWLSMKHEDSFMQRLTRLDDFPKLFEKKNRFGTYNEKTLGFLLYAENESEVLRDFLQQRVGTELKPYPETKLAKEKMKKKKIQERAMYGHELIMHAVSAFVEVLAKHDLNNDNMIDRNELTLALNDNKTFPERYKERLFGKHVSVDEVMAALDEDNDGKIHYHEITHFIERTGVSIQSHFLGYQRKEIKGLFSFFNTLQSTLLTNVKRVFVEEHDIDRTVGINTGHVGSTDFVLDEEDREFTVKQGTLSTEAFLRYYVAKNDPPKKICDTSAISAHHPHVPEHISSVKET